MADESQRAPRRPGHIANGEAMVRHPTTRPVPDRVTRPISVQDGARPDLPDFVTRVTRR